MEVNEKRYERKKIRSTTFTLLTLTGLLYM
jgi:hypothetical protein